MDMMENVQMIVYHYNRTAEMEKKKEQRNVMREKIMGNINEENRVR